MWNHFKLLECLFLQSTSNLNSYWWISWCNANSPSHCIKLMPNHINLCSSLISFLNFNKVVHKGSLYVLCLLTGLLIKISFFLPDRFIPQPVGLFPGKYSVAMVKGDCSLTISNVDLKIDDGEWECQVSVGWMFPLDRKRKERIEFDIAHHQQN